MCTIVIKQVHMLRKCSVCGEEKEIERFVKQTGKYRSDPYRKDCKDCRNFRRREKIKIEPKFWNRGTGKGRWTVNYHKWRNSVLERDNFECQECGEKEVLHCHHIISWKENYDLRFNVDNGKTLCRSCHIRLESLERHKKGISKETRKKMSESLKGHTSWNKGIPMTEEAKKNLSDKRKGNTLNKEIRKKISDSLKGRKAWNKGLTRYGPTNS